MKSHSLHGKKSNNATTNTIISKLMDHFHELTKLVEIRATKVVATLVDGAFGTVNRNNNEDEDDIYLPTSDGYRPCCYRYLKSLGYSAKPNSSGVVTVTWDGPGNMAGAPNYVCLSTCVTMWHHHYPHLKVSHPAEDICEMCYRFANRHCHLAVHNRDTSMATNSTDDGNLFQVMDDLNISMCLMRRMTTVTLTGTEYIKQYQMTLRRMSMKVCWNSPRRVRT
jgi:hypothetical protein